MRIGQLNKTVLATLLVGGTCVGGGILALPVETGSIGLFPSLLLLFFSWAFMTMTGLLYAEASLWMKEEGAHIVTMSRHLLGRWGEILAVLLYLFIGYASLIAYNSGGSILILNFVKSISGVGIPKWEACLIFGVVFGSVFYLGEKILGWINSIFVVGLVIAYFGMVTIGLGDIKTEMFDRFQWSGMYAALPLMITSFSFQMIVPSLALYLEHDEKALRRSISLGTMIPAAAYGVWLILVLGIVPNDGPFGLQSALTDAVVATESFKHFTNSKTLITFSNFFAFFAIVTSYLGIGLGLYDFLSDLTRVKKKGLGKILLGMLIILPTLYFTVIYPDAFVDALRITGGLGDSILNGLIPVSMVWIGRYVIGYQGYRFWGGKTVLICLAFFSVLILAAQVVKSFIYW